MDDAQLSSCFISRLSTRDIRWEPDHYWLGRYFIKWDGEDYTALYSGVLADEQYISKEIGTVNFKVADNVTNTSYKTKDGDAAFHEKGTRLFSIEGQEDLLAVKDESVVNGYRVYSAKEDTENKWDFNNLPLDKVQHIEIYLAYTQEGQNS